MTGDILCANVTLWVTDNGNLNSEALVMPGKIVKQECLVATNSILTWGPSVIIQCQSGCEL